MFTVAVLKQISWIHRYWLHLPRHGRGTGRCLPVGFSQQIEDEYYLGFGVDIHPNSHFKNCGSSLKPAAFGLSKTHSVNHFHQGRLLSKLQPAICLFQSTNMHPIFSLFNGTYQMIFSLFVLGQWQRSPQYRFQKNLCKSNQSCRRGKIPLRVNKRENI